MEQALKMVSSNRDLNETAQKTYAAWLGYYNGQVKKVGWSKEDLVREANEMAKVWGLSEQPSVDARAAGKMGLRKVAGLKVRK
jgi:ATP-dependent RNA helicase MSS116